MKFIKPERLQSGDKIAIISPSAGMPFLYPLVYEQGLRRIKEVFSLEPIEYPTARQSPEFLSNNPLARAEDINHAFADPSIKAIFSTIGGNDQIRILPFLNSEIIKSNPKIFLGYSDNTNLHLYLWNYGLISYYGGSVMTQFAMGGGMQDYTIQNIFKALFHENVGEIKSSPERTDEDLPWDDPKNLNIKRATIPSDDWEWENIKHGQIQGQFWGGCLEVLELHLKIKKYLPPLENLKDTVLYLETSEEMPSSGFVYRFFASLAELNTLQHFKAILMAYPKTQFLGQKPPEGSGEFIKNQKTAIRNALKDYGISIPIIFNMNFGHTDPQLIIPNGGNVLINFDQRKIEFN